MSEPEASEPTPVPLTEPWKPGTFIWTAVGIYFLSGIAFLAAHGDTVSGIGVLISVVLSAVGTAFALIGIIAIGIKVGLRQDRAAQSAS